MHSIAVQKAGKVDKQVRRTIEQADSSTSAQRGTICPDPNILHEALSIPKKSKEEVVNWLEGRQCSLLIRVSAPQYYLLLSIIQS